ncbi:MAG: DoxX family protein [Nitrospiraceae bacterium]
MYQYEPYASLVGRILLATIFLMSGVNKIMDPQGTQHYMAAMGMTTATFLFYLGAVVIEVGGGLSILLGYWARIGAAVLFLFMIPTTLIFHANFADQNQMIHFLKNMAMMGGLLYVMTYDAGRMSLDARLGSPAESQTATGIPVRDRRSTRLTG